MNINMEKRETEDSILFFSKKELYTDKLRKVWMWNDTEKSLENQ